MKHSKIVVRGGEMLLNPCFALLGKKPSKEALAFLNYLKSERGQKLISHFGKDSSTTLALFTPVSQSDF